CWVRRRSSISKGFGKHPPCYRPCSTMRGAATTCTHWRSFEPVTPCSWLVTIPGCIACCRGNAPSVHDGPLHVPALPPPHRDDSGVRVGRRRVECLAARV